MRRRLLALVVGVVGVAAASGCQRALFPEKEPRTQFETYDRLRQRSVPPTITDEFGRPRPALRARLAGS